jgi:uncharacterized membrane protein
MLPALMVIAVIGLSFLTIQLDEMFEYEYYQQLRWIYTGGAEGARTLLSTVAGSMITVAGVTFSITIVALSNTSTQFGPRLLGNFMRDFGNQVVLGTFVATFTYCLLILRVIRDVEDQPTIPHISITVGVFLAMTSMAVLIYFIHHVSTSINVENVITLVRTDLDQAIERLYPNKQSYYWQDWSTELTDKPENFEEESVAVEASVSGFIQSIDYDGLMHMAISEDLIFNIQYRPGVFVSEDRELVRAYPRDHFKEEFVERINDQFIIGLHRHNSQDVEFAVSKLVEIALRALSPSLNDPFTAMLCIDHLGVSLANLAERSIPSAYRYDDEGKLRLITDRATFVGVLNAAFDQIRQHSVGDVAVTIRLLETIEVIAVHAKAKYQRQALHRQAVMIWRASQTNVPEKWDRDDIHERFESVMSVLGQEG